MPPTVSPVLRAEIDALAQDLSLAPELGAMRLVLGRLLVAIDDDSADLRRLAQTAATVTNAIVRVIQTQSRLAGPSSALDDEVDRALDDIGDLEEVSDRSAPCPQPPRPAVRAAESPAQPRSSRRLRGRDPPDSR